MSAPKLGVQLPALAESDIEDIALFIAADSPLRALSFIGELRNKCADIAQNPEIYRLREEYGVGIRVTVYGADLIFHAVRADAIVIERILHGARHLEWVRL